MCLCLGGAEFVSNSGNCYCALSAVWSMFGGRRVSPLLPSHHCSSPRVTSSLHLSLSTSVRPLRLTRCSQGMCMSMCNVCTLAFWVISPFAPVYTCFEKNCIKVTQHNLSDDVFFQTKMACLQTCPLTLDTLLNKCSSTIYMYFSACLVPSIKKVLLSIGTSHLKSTTFVINWGYKLRTLH